MHQFRFTAFILCAAMLSSCRDEPPSEERYDTSVGRWRPMDWSGDPNLTAEQEAALERLRSVGYLAGSKPATPRSGVTVNIPDSVQAGFNLYVSGHAPKAFLMDMKGRVVHTWSFAFQDAFPDYPLPAETVGDEFWRRAHLFENGDLLAIYEGLGIVRLDRDSRLLWANNRECHHDLDVNEIGTIFVLTRRAKMLPRIHSSEPVLEDFVTVLDPGGQVIEEVSILEALEHSEYRHVLERMPPEGDLLHTNTVEFLDGSQAARSPIFSKGNVLVSFRTIDAIAILDLRLKVAVWAVRGPWSQQHQPALLPGGTMLLFDNYGHHGKSKVLEFDPMSGEVTWTYDGASEGGFFTHDCGTTERLPNGNTLIVESNSGRAFEVTRSGTIVWEFLNPARAGEAGELVATLFDLVRIEPEFLAGWLKASK